MPDFTKLIEREKAIREKVNSLEGLHKTCQLSAIGILEPVLNESRYLARALAELLFFERGSEEHVMALNHAEHAVACGINDAIDILLTFLKAGLQRIAKDYPNFKIAQSAFGLEYINALKAMEELDPKIVSSRIDRSQRSEIYEDISQSPALTVIANFAMKLQRVEALAQQTQTDGWAAYSDSHGWLSDKLSAALKDPTGEVKLEVHYQPKYTYSDGAAVCDGAEALMRLSDGTSKISPANFIPCAEKSGLIDALGLFALESTVQFLKRNPTLPRISVNVSTYELTNSEYSANVVRLVRDVLGGDGSRLELEITEGAALNDVESFRHIEIIAETGVRIAIDDFGTGLTRFDYIASLPIHVLKIDQSLTQAYKRTPKKWEKLLRAIVAVAKTCELELIAEGVESKEETFALKEKIGVLKYQGWGFGKAVSEDEFLSAHVSTAL